MQKEKLSIDSIDRLHNLLNEINNTKALCMLLDKYFNTDINFKKAIPDFELYGILNETIIKKLFEMADDLKDLTDKLAKN